MAERCAGEFFDEILVGAEVAVDGRGDGAGGLAAALGLHALPIKGVIPNLGSLIEHHALRAENDLFQSRVGGIGLHFIQLHHIGVVMFSMMQFEIFLGQMRLEGIGGVGQRRQSNGHGVSLAGGMGRTIGQRRCQYKRTTQEFAQSVTIYGNFIPCASVSIMTHAANIRRLRKLGKLTQANLAERAGIPRATLANMEQDDSNPGVQSILAVAKALGVGMDELLSPSPERRYFKVTSDEQQEYRAENGRFLSRLMSPIASKGVQIQHVTILPGCRSIGRPHPLGAQEYFLTLSGSALLQIDDETVDVEAGALVQFPGHRKHVYINRDPIQVATGISVVVFQPG